MKTIHTIIKNTIVFVVAAISALTSTSCKDNETSGGYTDPTLKVTITPLRVKLQEIYEDCDALAVQWHWTDGSEFEQNPDVTFTLELAKARTDFRSPYYYILGDSELAGMCMFTVRELNRMLIRNGLIDNGDAGDLEARVVATTDSYRGCRSLPTMFSVETYYLDPNALPPYERIWFVGDFTGWNFLEMTRNEDNPFEFWIDGTFDDASARDKTYDFKFGVHEPGSERQWYDMYHPPYKDAPVTETKVVQIESDVTNDFKWKVTPEQLGKKYHIVLNITKGEERMTCTLLGGDEPPAGDTDYGSDSDHEGFESDGSNDNNPTAGEGTHEGFESEASGNQSADGNHEGFAPIG